jgi:hypothetical protein
VSPTCTTESGAERSVPVGTYGPESGSPGIICISQTPVSGRGVVGPGELYRLLQQTSPPPTSIPSTARAQGSSRAAHTKRAAPEGTALLGIGRWGSPPTELHATPPSAPLPDEQEDPRHGPRTGRRSRRQRLPRFRFLPPHQTWTGEGRAEPGIGNDESPSPGRMPVCTRGGAGAVLYLHTPPTDSPAKEHPLGTPTEIFSG